MTPRDKRQIRCSVLRGGTSRGVFLHAEDLPADRGAVERILLLLMGSPDARQINGLGGGTSVTSKVAIVAPAHDGSGGVDYTFAQVDVTRPIVDWGGTCGNILAAVGMFAVDAGMVTVPRDAPDVEVPVNLTNTRQRATVRVETWGGLANDHGNFSIPGVPGAGAPVAVTFLNPGGSYHHGVLPTRTPKNRIVLKSGRELSVSLVDAGVPVVFVPAAGVGLLGTEAPADIDSHPALQEMEEIRSVAACWLGIVDDPKDATKVTPGVPKVICVAEPARYTAIGGEVIPSASADIAARQLSMQRAHQSYGVTAAVATAAAAAIEGTIVADVLKESPDRIRIGQPYGVIEVAAEIERSGSGPESVDVKSVTLYRTARHIIDGKAWLTEAVLPESADPSRVIARNC